MQKSLTSGSALKNIVCFSLPYLLSYFLQTLYGMADLFIIGQYEGVASTTSVSIGSQVMHVLTVIMVGLTMGSTVSIGQAVGAKQHKKAAACIGNTVTLFAALSLVLTAVLLLCARPITRLMATPEAAVEGTVRYLTICFLGIPFITAYNIISAVFRGMGDSKRPMYFVAVACAANIALDYLFMGALRMGPAGAALGTTLAQTISVIAALLALRRHPADVRVSRRDFHPQRSVLARILRIGLPVAAQDGFIQVSFILITILANQRGLTDAAAVGIVEKIMSFLFLIPSSMPSAVSAIDAQNIGAGKPERVKEAFRCQFTVCVGYTVVFWLLLMVVPQVFAGIFTSDVELVTYTAWAIRIFLAGAFSVGFQISCQQSFMALGQAKYSLLMACLRKLILLIPLIFILPNFFADKVFAVFLAEPVSDILAAAITTITFLTHFNKFLYGDKKQA